MDDLAVADVHGNVVDRAAAVGVEDQIAGTHLAGLHRLAHLGLGSGVMRQGHAELLHHLHGEAGAVRALSQAGAAPHVGIPHELKGVVDHLGTPGRRGVCRFLGRRELDGLVQRIAHLHVVVPGGDVSLVALGAVLLVHGIQLNLHPAVQLGQHRVALVLHDLGPDLGIRIWLGADIEHVRVDHGPQSGRLHGDILRLLASGRVLGIRRDISGNGTGLDLVPSVQAFQDFTRRLTGHLTDDLAVGFGLRPDV